MKGEFIIKVGSALVTYDDYDDIPMEFDNLISFKPDAPEPPHSEEDHEEMEKYNTKLQELMGRENASSN
jgi:hypothetical protein